MTFATSQIAPADPIADAARLLGRRGGRPKGSYSSLLAIWLRAEIKQRKAHGYRCREAFCILRDSEEPDGLNAFLVKDWTADEHGLDIATRVTWDYFKKIWKKAGRQKPVSVPFVRKIRPDNRARHDHGNETIQQNQPTEADESTCRERHCQF